MKKSFYITSLAASILLFYFLGNVLPQNTLGVKTIYVVPVLGHLDLGFTATQREVRQKWPSIYRDGMEFLTRHPEATLTSDSLLPLEWFREDASPDEWGRFRELVRSGRWELTAGWAHMNTALLSEAESRGYFLMARRWEEEFGVPIKIWLHADVPGLGWNMAEAATDSNMDMIVVGANELGGLTPVPKELPRLFLWQAPDGESIPVSLHKGSGYMEGGLDLALHEPEGLEKRVREFERGLRDSGYPLDTAMVLFSSGDNKGPEIFEKLLVSIADWNSKGKTPEIQLSTLSNFKQVVKENEGQLTTVRGDWPAPWEMLVRRAPRGESAARQAQRNIAVAEALAVVNGDSETAALDTAWRNLLLHDEHSGTGSWPKMLTLEQAIEQNRAEYQYAADAEAQSEFLVREGLDTLASKIKSPVPGRTLFFNMSGQYKNLAMLFEENRIISSEKIVGIGYRVGDSAAEYEGSFDDEPVSLWELEQAGGEYLAGLDEQVEWFPGAFGRLFISRLALQYSPDLKAQKRSYFYAVRKGQAPYSFVGLMRGSLWIDKHVSASAGTYYYADGIYVTEGGKRGLVVSTLDGAPFQLDIARVLRSLMFIAEPVAVLKNDAQTYVAPEPEGNEPIISRYLLEQGTNDRSALQIFNSANPIAATFLGANDGRGCLPVSGGNFISSDNANVWITGIRQSRFGEGFILSIRNVSEKTKTARFTSDFWQFTYAEQVDGQERNADNGKLFCEDPGRKKAGCASGIKMTPGVRVKPREVIEIRLEFEPLDGLGACLPN